MTTYEYGDMWSAWEASDLFLITTNATIKGNSALVMGRGIARQARDRWPGLDIVMGRAIGSSGRKYGLLVGKGKLGAFQVKHHYWELASVELIKLSVDMLLKWCAAHPGKRVDLNYPGIGNGKLPIEVVQPIIERLPASVHVWRFR